MAGSRGKTLAGFALIMLVGMASAHAANGRIVFSGAVVAPTCSIEDEHADMASGLRSGDGVETARLSCGKTISDPGRSYARHVVSLDAATIANDRLLAYFAGYANDESADGIKPQLVVRIYE